MWCVIAKSCDWFSSTNLCQYRNRFDNPNFSLVTFANFWFLTFQFSVLSLVSKRKQFYKRQKKFWLTVDCVIIHPPHLFGAFIHPLTRSTTSLTSNYLVLSMRLFYDCAFNLIPYHEKKCPQHFTKIIDFDFDLMIFFKNRQNTKK